jgi:hypothetical protein
MVETIAVKTIVRSKFSRKIEPRTAIKPSGRMCLFIVF